MARKDFAETNKAEIGKIRLTVSILNSELSNAIHIFRNIKDWPQHLVFN